MNNFYYTLDFFYLCDMHAIGAKSIAFAGTMGTTVQELGSSGTTGRVGGSSSKKCFVSFLIR